ncbi:GtrA family protein [Agromyces sp. NPDC058136]|uniref:GtrA family protein n=1 Tax=Agromyces sp. NPDC058136 TaxID=3346354 RepID=UPI0036DD1CD9
MGSGEAPRSFLGAAWRFLVVGGTNTLATSLLLIVLSYLMEGWLAYTIAFGAGLVYSTLFASRWVFTRAASWRVSLLYACCYIAIYFVGLACVAVIQTFDWPDALNVLSVLVTAPLGFVAGRLVFREDQREHHNQEETHE